MPITFTTLAEPPVTPPGAVAPPTTITGTDILDLIPGIGQVRSGVKFYLLDKSFRRIGDIAPISESPASVEVRGADTMKRKLRGLELSPSDWSQINPNSDRIMPYWMLETGDVYPLGIFLFSDVAKHQETSGVWADGSLTDLTTIIDQPRARSISKGKGASVHAAILEILDEVGVTFYEIDDSNATFGSPVSWPAGESRYKVLADLFTLAEFYPPYFDNFGKLRGRAVPTDLAHQEWDHIYSSGQTSRMIAGTLVENDNTVKAPNRYLVIDTGPTDHAIAGAYRIPAHWPHSLENRGYLVTEKVTVNGLKDKAAAVRVARMSAVVDLRAGFNDITFDATPDPRHDVFDIVRYRGVNYREAGWSLRLAPGGPHRHTLRGTY